MATSSAPPIPPFLVDSDRSNVGYRWKKWLEKFDNYLVAVNIADDRRQKALLLLYGGDQLYDIATSLDMTPTPAAGNGANAVAAETQFAAAKRVLTAHFHPQANKQFNQIAFRELAQKTDESIDQFYARVKEHAAGCEFPDADAQIRTQLICGTRSKKFRSLPLGDSSSTLTQLLDKGKAMEQADARQSEMDNPGKSDQQVNSLRSRSHQHNGSRSKQKHDRGSSSRKERRYRNYRDRSSSSSSSEDPPCPYCGGEFHVDGLSNCPARGKTCGHCDRVDHFESQCLIKRSEEKEKKKKKKRQPSTPPKRNVRFTDHDDDDESSDDGEANYLHIFATADSRERAPRSSLIINNTLSTFLLDSASTSTIIGRTQLHQLGNIKLEKTRRKIFPYGQSRPLDIDGVFTAQLSLPGSRKRVTEEIYVTSSSTGSNILSCSASLHLGLIKFANQVELSAINHRQQAPIQHPAPANKLGPVWTSSSIISAPVNKPEPSGVSKNNNNNNKQTTLQHPALSPPSRPHSTVNNSPALQGQNGWKQEEVEDQHPSNQRLPDLQLGDKVFLRRQQSSYNQHSSFYDPEPYMVISINGSSYSAQNNSGFIITRPISFIHKLPGYPAKTQQGEEEYHPPDLAEEQTGSESSQLLSTPEPPDTIQQQQ